MERRGEGRKGERDGTKEQSSTAKYVVDQHVEEPNCLSADARRGEGRLDCMRFECTGDVLFIASDRGLQGAQIVALSPRLGQSLSGEALSMSQDRKRDPYSY